LTTKNLKDDLSHFRNICQHVNVNSLDTILSYLRVQAEEKLKQLMSTEGKLIDIEDLEADESPENIIMMSVGATNETEEKERIVPAMKLVWESYKIILDTIR
jgi:translation initiation factor 3 subunit A